VASLCRPLLRDNGIDRADRGHALHLRLRHDGRVHCWLIGWESHSEYALGAVTVAIDVWLCGEFPALINRLVVPVGLRAVPLALSDADDPDWQTTGRIINLPAMVVIAGISALLWWACTNPRGSTASSSDQAGHRPGVIAVAGAVRQYAALGNACESWRRFHSAIWPGLFGWSGVVRVRRRISTNRLRRGLDGVAGSQKPAVATCRIRHSRSLGYARCSM